MGSRIAVATALVLGAFLIVAAGALAVTGPSASNDASSGQYNCCHKDHNNNNNKNNNDNGNNDNNNDSNAQASPSLSANPQGGGGGGGGTVHSTTSPPKVTSSFSRGGGGAQNLGAPSGKLPFTGYPLIAVLLVGLALLATGVIARRRLGSSETA